MRVYHGSYTAIEKPEILTSKFPKDFGEGFYCTKLEAQAERWANRYDKAVVSIYNYISDFIDGILNREQFWVLAKFKHPTHQVCFCTNKALSTLQFLKSKTINNDDRQRK